MFNVGGGELLVILLIALIVLGPQRLPDAARQVGKVMAEVRRVSSGFQNELKTAFDTEPDTEPSRKVTPLAASVAEADAEAAAGTTDTDPDAGDEPTGEQHSEADGSPPEMDGSPPEIAGDGAEADAGDAADETPAPSSVARPVADALDEIVTPLDDQRAAS